MLEDDVPLAESTDVSHKPADATSKGKSFVMQLSIRELCRKSCFVDVLGSSLNFLGLGMCSRPSRRPTTP